MRALAVAMALAIGAGPAAVSPAHAQKTGGMPIIRDTEIEQLLRDYATPILKAAGMAKQNVKVVVLNDRAFNAFVMDGRHIFINAGALFDAKTPNEVIGVFAHETGHLAGGHLLKLREQLASAQTASIVAMLLGVGAAVAGARAGSGGGNIGAAAILAPQSAIQRSLLAYVRTQEDSADHAGAKFLQATGQSGRGMVELFKRLSSDALFNSRYIDPYMQSHPMPAERVAALNTLVKASPYFNTKDSDALQARHDMMRAKLAGFLERSDTVARRYPLGDHSLPARYARAISAYRHTDLRQAIAQIDGLIQAQPANPYFYELKGQALLEGGRATEAVAPLRQAAQLSRGAPLIQMMLAQALIGTNNAKSAEEAVALLRGALLREPEAPQAYTQLAMAYGRKGDLAQADLASAQAAFSRGDMMTARQLASRAKTRLPIGSPAWVQADDIVNLKPTNARN
ncbi:MAG: M48 family metalloprotease [Pseudolabrys sp.]|nr:M48 family metalloprotease [Pseudolabrys sp.]MDP2295285.1 M48 family metalloprotease [Pseudolabrys sp.]